VSLQAVWLSCRTTRCLSETRVGARTSETAASPDRSKEVSCKGQAKQSQCMGAVSKYICICCDVKSSTAPEQGLCGTPRLAVPHSANGRSTQPSCPQYSSCLQGLPGSLCNPVCHREPNLWRDPYLWQLLQGCLYGCCCEVWAVPEAQAGQAVQALQA